MLKITIHAEFMGIPFFNVSFRKKKRNELKNYFNVVFDYSVLEKHLSGTDFSYSVDLLPVILN